MSILNRTNDGFFNILLVVYHTVLESGAIDKDTLLKRCSPLPIDTKDVNNTLKRWIELGLFVVSKEDNNQKITIPEEYRLKKKQPSCVILNNLPKILRKIVFLEENNNKFGMQKNRKVLIFRELLVGCFVRIFIQLILKTMIKFLNWKVINLAQMPPS